MNGTEEEKNPASQAPGTITLPYGKMAIMFAAMLIGLLLVVIGLNHDNYDVYYAGAFILPAAFFWGGLFLNEENSGIRITLLAVGGYLTASLLSGVSSFLSSLL